VNATFDIVIRRKPKTQGVSMQDFCLRLQVEIDEEQPTLVGPAEQAG
jgi:hypothetical protein